MEMKEAVAIAKSNAIDVFEGKLLNLLVEEIKKGSNGHWLITLGFEVPNEVQGNALGQALAAMGNRSNRKYKVFEVDPEEKVVIDISMRAPL